MTAPELPFYPITHDDGLSIVDALNDIADTQNSPSLIAEDFDETKNYIIGDYVIYSACLYRFVAPHSAGAWNSGHATQVRVGEELGDKANNSIVAPAFRSDWNYDVNDVVTYQGGLYRFITAHSAGDWNRSQVVTTNAISEGGGGGGGGGGGAGIGDVVTFDEHTMIVTSSERTLEPLESSIAIVANGDTHIAIDSGQYVYVKNHGALDEGLYIANSDIDEDEELTASNLTKDTEGGLNKLDSSISAIDSSLAIVADGDTHIAISSGECVYVKNHSLLPEGLYTANSAIGANVSLTTSNLTSVSNSKGGFNKIVDIAHGGTGATTVAAARNAFGLGNTNGALPIANGGTGATTVTSMVSNFFKVTTTSVSATITARAATGFDGPTISQSGYKPLFYSVYPGSYCDRVMWQCGNISISENSVKVGTFYLCSLYDSTTTVYFRVMVLWYKA